jgi:hypothetical protein
MGKYIEATTEINDQSSKKRKLNTEESENSKLNEAAQFMSHFKCKLTLVHFSNQFTNLLFSISRRQSST